jgi:hypothetical protein
MDSKKVHVIPVYVFWYGRRIVPLFLDSSLSMSFGMVDVCKPYHLPYIPLFLDSLADQ